MQKLRSLPHPALLGVIAESRDWRARGLDGPHHLDEAASSAATSLADIEAALLRF